MPKMLVCYVELLLLVSLIPVAMPQIRNLSPLRGILNTGLPDSFRTTTVATFASAGAGFDVGFESQNQGPNLRAGVIPFFSIPNAPGAIGTNGGTAGGFNSFSGAGGASSGAAASSFGASAGFGGGAPSPPRRIIISADDVEDALEFAFVQSTSSNRFRPQGQRPPPPVAAFIPQSFGGSAADGGEYGSIVHGPHN